MLCLHLALITYNNPVVDKCNMNDKCSENYYGLVKILLCLHAGSD